MVTELPLYPQKNKTPTGLEQREGGVDRIFTIRLTIPSNLSYNTLIFDLLLVCKTG